jgi:hypothetical protein
MMMMMKRAAIMMAMAMLVSAGITRAAAQEKTMTAVGDVKTVEADGLVINDGAGKDWTFVINSKTKIILKDEIVAVPPTTNLNKVTPKKWEITDIKQGQRVQVKYRAVKGKNLATRVQTM